MGHLKALVFVGALIVITMQFTPGQSLTLNRRSIIVARSRAMRWRQWRRYPKNCLPLMSMMCSSIVPVCRQSVMSKRSIPDEEQNGELSREKRSNRRIRVRRRFLVNCRTCKSCW